MTGRMYSQGLGNIHFWFWQIGIFGKVCMMYWLGYAYFPRWVVDYLPLPQWVMPQMILTLSAYLIGLGFIVFIIIFALMSSRGQAVTGDPWAVSDDALLAAPAPAE